MMEEKMRRLQDQNEAIMDLVAELRQIGWSADAHFHQDGTIHVIIKKLDEGETV
jgi:hypothetical protein